jgi:hypothetical protein
MLHINHALCLSAIWSLVLLALYWLLPRWALARQACYGWPLLVAVGLVARAVPWVVLPNGAQFDIESYKIVAQLVLQREDVYTAAIAAGRHPYLPLMLYWLGFAELVARETSMSFVHVVKIAPILADVAIGAAVHRAALHRRPPPVAFSYGLAYAVNPVTIYVCAYHGQFDALPTLFGMLSALMAGTSPAAAGAWLGLGILCKSWPAIGLPSLLLGLESVRIRFRALSATAFVPLLGVATYSVLFGASPVPALVNAVSYNWGIGIWGYGYILRLLSIATPTTSFLLEWILLYGRYATLAWMAVTWYFVAGRKDLWYALFVLILCFLALGHAFSIQYLCWIVPFAMVASNRRMVDLFVSSAFLYMFVAYNGLVLYPYVTHIMPLPQGDWFIIMLSGVPAWLVCMAWLAQQAASALRKRLTPPMYAGVSQ